MNPVDGVGGSRSARARLPERVGRVVNDPFAEFASDGAPSSSIMSAKSWVASS